MRLLLLLALTISASAQNGLPGPDLEAAIGLGIAVVRTGDAPPPLRFYSHPDLEELPHEVPPSSATVTDSVTFVPRRGRASVGTAPPWFLPEILDIEAGHIGMRVVTLTTDWVEVVLNRADGRTAYVRRDRVEVVAWPDVLLQSLVTLHDPEANPIRLRPDLEAAVLIMTSEDWRLRVLSVRGDWLLVSTLGLADRIRPSGWVRWTDGRRLLVGGVGRE